MRSCVRARLREHDRDRDLQLSGFRAGMQWQLHRVRRRGLSARRPRRGRAPGYVPAAGRRHRRRVRRPSSIWISCGITGNTRCRGNAYRHPELYGMLCSGAVDPPFVRPEPTCRPPCRNAVRRLAGASPVRRFVPGSVRRRQAPPAGTRLRVGCRTRRRSPRRSVVRRPPRCCRRVR